MNYEIVTLEKKIIAGLTNRTGNNDPLCGKIIGGLWQKFMGEGIYNNLKNKVNEYSIGLYSDYDFSNNTYDVTVGAEVSECENAELSLKTIPGGKYALFSITGDVVEDVSKAWEEIWTMPLERTFSGDFEEYLSNDNGNAKINIYVALK